MTSHDRKKDLIFIFPSSGVGGLRCNGAFVDKGGCHGFPDRSI